MGLIQDVGGKLFQSFLSLDDLVLGQGVLSEGRSQLELTGRSVAGSIAVGSNIAVRAAHAGIQAGAKTACATASAFEGFVPGAGLARSLAQRVDKEATAAGEEASKIANYAVELANREVPRNPLTQEKWLGKSIPFGYGWSELAADTAIGSIGRLAALPLAVGRDTTMMVASSTAGRELIEASLKGLGILLSPLPGSQSTELDTSSLREVLMALTSSSGDPAARNLTTLTEAAARFIFGDTRRLHEGIVEAIDQMRWLAEHAELSELMSSIPVTATLQKRARRIVDHAPSRFLKALEPSSAGESPQPGAVLSAILTDVNPLRILVTEYPIILALMGTHVNLLMTAGMLDVGKIEAYVKTENTALASRPWSATHLEATLGQAPEALFEATIQVARDTVFTYTADVLGRRKALARMEDLYGEGVRNRLEADISLDHELRRLTRARQDAKLRRKISDIERTEALTRQRDICQDQLDSLRAFTRSLSGYQPKEIAQRTSLLSIFVSLIDQNLALRGSDGGHHEERMEALSRFEAWSSNS